MPISIPSYRDPIAAFPVGKVIPLGPISVTKDDIIKFAAKYDPIYFHLDEKAAENSILGGLAASGFHTCSLVMRMLCDAYLLDSTSQGGPSVEEVYWHAPVRPNDTLHGTSTVLDARHSNSHTDQMIIKFKYEVFNQNEVKVITMTNTGFFKTTTDLGSEF